MATAPSTNNYMVGKGRVYFTPTGGSRRAVGNVTSLEVTPEVEELDHYTSQQGVRSKDKSIILEKNLSVRMVMDEWSAENVEMALLGTSAVNSEGNIEIEIFATDKVEGILEFEASNDVGPRFNLYFHNVAFRPDAAINMISEEWAEMELVGEVTVNAQGSWGTITQIDSNTETES